MDQNRSAEFDNFIRTVRLDELFKIATNHRGGSPCVLGRHTIGGMQLLTCALLIIEALELSC